MGQVELTPAVDGDSDFAYQTKRLAFKVHFEAVAPWGEDEQRRLHARRFSEQEFFVVREAGTRVGILALSSAQDHLAVKQLFLLPEHQGRGVGQAVMARVLERARRERRGVRLRSLKTNLRAVSFFEALGFTRESSSATHHHFMLDPGSGESSGGAL